MTTTPRSTTARGYGTAHQAERARWAPIVEAGGAQCTAPICLEPDRTIAPDDEWDLGHNDDRTGWRGPEHPRCNRAEGGRNGAAAANAKRKTTVREPW